MKEQTVTVAGLKALFDGRTLDFSESMLVEDAIVPARLVVCYSCEGRGTTTSHVECDGGGFTGSEWAEVCDGDPDFAEDYMSGKYDRPCPDCNGKNVVPEIDEEHADPEILKAINEAAREESAYRAEVAAERRMGA